VSTQVGSSSEVVVGLFAFACTGPLSATAAAATRFFEMADFIKKVFGTSEGFRT
jgi:hypothetical protein